ncbi:hypothetical protein B1H19_28695 [Streptomyces gilvosporeus]|uniref:Magnesium chelatase n=1 Tax=Streptomyces gilvosporeus TaxID=553510 RepID=A0A1V0TY77_9ACTN|nr:hypothetical protein B1H19_28695 [Streptomyces gilvosporeus]
MGFARTCSVALVGVEGVVVEVQADLEPGVAAFTLVGLPDKSLVESKDRVRAAVVFPVKSICSALGGRPGPRCLKSHLGVGGRRHHRGSITARSFLAYA